MARVPLIPTEKKKEKLLLWCGALFSPAVRDYVAVCQVAKLVALSPGLLVFCFFFRVATTVCLSVVK